MSTTNMASCTSDEAESSSAASSRAAASGPSSNRYREKSRFIEDLDTDPSPEILLRLLAVKPVAQGPARPQASRARSSPVVITLRPPPPAPLRFSLPRKERKKRPSSGLFAFFSPPIPTTSPLVAARNSPPVQRRSSIFRRGSISPAVRSTGTQPFPSEQSQDSYFPPERDWRFWRRRRSSVASEDKEDSRRKSFAFGEAARSGQEVLSPLEPPRLRVNSGAMAPRSSSPLVHSVISDDNDDVSEVSPTALEMIDEVVNELSSPLPQGEGRSKDLSFRKLPKELYTQHTRRRSGSAAEAVSGLFPIVQGEKQNSIRRRAVSVLGLTRPSWVSEEFGTGSDDEEDSVASLPVSPVARAKGHLPLAPPRDSSLPLTTLVIPSHYPTPAFPGLSSSTSTSTVDNDSSPIDRDDEASSVARPSSDESDGGWHRKMKDRERERERWWALSKRATRETTPARHARA